MDNRRIREIEASYGAPIDMVIKVRDKTGAGNRSWEYVSRIAWDSGHLYPVSTQRQSRAMRFASAYHAAAVARAVVCEDVDDYKIVRLRPRPHRP